MAEGAAIGEEEGGTLRTVGGCTMAFGCLFCIVGFITLAFAIVGTMDEEIGSVVSGLGGIGLCCGVGILVIGVVASLLGGNIEE